MTQASRSRSPWFFRFALLLLAVAAMSDLFGGVWLVLLNGMLTLMFLGMAATMAVIAGAFFIALLG
ncbi:hypothetical protein E4T66_13625 [Sinimarinibacterium sp. CAU 1509]|uniref:hypothetical protein n=1 Tax=Sinimarinibacterium sp. CAU 1509 TaxID=2562283 RepID=UPI0010ABFF5F|nr:hypothetical protein [Sinimarinibacterium sp. CAU 1509]TJY59425.1 hypothetical protein E4T66_13625 [Sinimarinibacterium sp. CAU 1509]